LRKIGQTEKKTANTSLTAAAKSGSSCYVAQQAAADICQKLKANPEVWNPFNRFHFSFLEHDADSAAVLTGRYLGRGLNQTVDFRRV